MADRKRGLCRENAAGIRTVGQPNKRRARFIHECGMTTGEKPGEIFRSDPGVRMHGDLRRTDDPALVFGEREISNWKIPNLTGE